MGLEESFRCHRLLVWLGGEVSAANWVRDQSREKATEAMAAPAQGQEVWMQQHFHEAAERCREGSVHSLADMREVLAWS